MLSKATEQLVKEIYTYFDREEDEEMVQKDPEACLLAMLLVIKKELPLSYAVLNMTIEKAPSYLEEAQKKIEKAK